jgi:hypothetical protein
LQFVSFVVPFIVECVELPGAGAVARGGATLVHLLLLEMMDALFLLDVDG